METAMATLVIAMEIPETMVMAMEILEKLTIHRERKMLLSRALKFLAVLLKSQLQNMWLIL